MLTAVLVAGVLSVALTAYARSPRVRRELVRFFEAHARYYGDSPNGWITSGYVAAAFGAGIYHHLRELADVGVLERREGGTSRERWARGARPVVYYRLRQR